MHECHSNTVVLLVSDNYESTEEQRGGDEDCQRLEIRCDGD